MGSQSMNDNSNPLLLKGQLAKLKMPCLRNLSKVQGFTKGFSQLVSTKYIFLVFTNVTRVNLQDIQRRSVREDFLIHCGECVSEQSEIMFYDISPFSPRQGAAVINHKSPPPA